MKFPIILATSAAALVLSANVSAMDVKVKSIERVATQAPKTETFYPIFTADGKGLFVTGEAYDGLGLIDLSDGTYKQISSRPTAGYKFVQGPGSSEVVLREIHFDSQTQSIYKVDVATAAEECVLPVIEHTNTLTFADGVIAYAEPYEKTVKTWADPRLATPMAVKKAEQAPLLTEEDLKLVLYRGGQRTVVDPILETTGKDVNYCWSSISPDGQHLLFVAHNECYTSNLDGTDLKCYGAIHAPVWRGNDMIVGMTDADDGYFFTASDIVIADRKTAETVQLTPESDEIKMYPSVSPDGNRIAFSTLDGDIYIITLND